MSNYRTRNQQLWVGVESATGTEETLTVADAVAVQFPIPFSPQFEIIDTNYVTGSLSQSPPQTGGGFVGIDPTTFLAGVASPGTNAPDWGKLVRACGLSETLTAAAETGTATAGAASSITLEGTASAVDDAYVGMPIRLTGGTGSGQMRVISAYDGTTKVVTVFPNWDTTPDNTSAYSIDANALYRPVSSGLETVTMYGLQRANSGNSKRRKLVGGAGTFNLTITPRQLAQIAFQMRGILPAAPDDVADPGAPTYTNTDPRPYISAKSYLGAGSNTTMVKFTEFRFELGAAVEMFDNPGAAFGYDPGAVLSRQSTGRITPDLTLNSARNAFQDFLDSAQRSIWLQWGTVAGQRISLWMPEIRLTGNEPGDQRGFAVEGLPFRSSQADGEIFICVH